VAHTNKTAPFADFCTPRNAADIYCSITYYTHLPAQISFKHISRDSEAVLCTVKTCFKKRLAEAELLQCQYTIQPWHVLCCHIFLNFMFSVEDFVKQINLCFQD